jgi:hypothetical protein
MPTIGEVFNAFAIKAGIKPDNEQLIGILAAPGLAQITVPDELVTQMDAGLLNIEAAKNGHPEIRNKYRSEVYDGLDTLIHGLPVDSEVLDIVKAEKLTSKKIQLLVDKLKASKPEDKTEGAVLKNKISELQNQLRVFAEEKETLTQQTEQRIKDMQLDMALEGVLSGYSTVYDTLPGDVKKITLKSLLNKNLQDSNAVLSIGENGSLTIVNKDGSKVFGSDHREITPANFLDKTFASILKVTTPATPATPVIPANGKQPANNEFVSQFTQGALKDFETSAANGVKMI